MANQQRGANWSDDEIWIIIRLYGEESVQTMRGTRVNKRVYEDIAKILKAQHGIEKKCQQCRLKIRKLKQKYKKENDKTSNIYTVTEIDMGPELSTAVADQNFALICKQLQDQIGSVLFFQIGSVLFFQGSATQW